MLAIQHVAKYWRSVCQYAFQVPVCDIGQAGDEGLARCWAHAFLHALFGDDPLRTRIRLTFTPSCRPTRSMIETNRFMRAGCGQDASLFTSRHRHLQTKHQPVQLAITVRICRHPQQLGETSAATHHVTGHCQPQRPHAHRGRPGAASSVLRGPAVGCRRTLRHLPLV